MINYGWRSIILDSRSSISISNENLIINSEFTEKRIPISQIGTVMFNDLDTEISIKDLIKLNESKIKLIFCDKKHNPNCEVIPYSANHFSSNKLDTQINWNLERKQIVWQKIIKQKIKNQAEIVKDINTKSYWILKNYEKQTLLNDSSNRESQAARVYFYALFGYSYRRRKESDINSALNYGYSIILSLVNRFVTIFGYNTALGIKHHNCENPFNLSCDLMEPFRFYIDKYVYENKDREFDISYKRELLSLIYRNISIGNENTTLYIAIEKYVKEVLDELSSNRDCIKEMRFGA